MGNDHHILNAASNLLGIALLLIAGLHISNTAGKTLADEVAWIAAVCFSTSCLLSYLSIRSSGNGDWSELAADRIFLGGLVCILAAVAVLASSSMV
ncbi:MAG: hypothetical protein ACKVOL_01260 [Novosphingobium sp.]